MYTIYFLHLLPPDEVICWWLCGCVIVWLCSCHCWWELMSSMDNLLHPPFINEWVQYIQFRVYWIYTWNYPCNFVLHFSEKNFLHSLMLLIPYGSQFTLVSKYWRLLFHREKAYILCGQTFLSPFHFMLPHAFFVVASILHFTFDSLYESFERVEMKETRIDSLYQSVPDHWHTSHLEKVVFTIFSLTFRLRVKFDSLSFLSPSFLLFFTLLSSVAFRAEIQFTFLCQRLNRLDLPWTLKQLVHNGQVSWTCRHLWLIWWHWR